MQFPIYQWLIPPVCLYFLYRTYQQHQKGLQYPIATIMWFLFWIIILLIALVPDLVTSRLAHFFGFESNINALIFTALGYLFVLVYNMYSYVNRLERKITELTRTLAKERAMKPSNSKQHQETV